MMYATETRSKDGNLGALIKADTVNGVLDICADWLEETGLKSEDLEPTFIFDSNGDVVSDLRFE